MRRGSARVECREHQRLLLPKRDRRNQKSDGRPCSAVPVEKMMQRDQKYSDQTPSREQAPVPQGHKPFPADEPDAAVVDEKEVDESAKKGLKDAAGKSPRGDI